NQTHGSSKTFSHYINKMKILKTKYLSGDELLRFSFGFGCDSTTKRFMAREEVWTEYIKLQKNCGETFEELDDLNVIFERN
ncbi:unnamed protein product, partial [Brassica napus]